MSVASRYKLILLVVGIFVLLHPAIALAVGDKQPLLKGEVLTSDTAQYALFGIECIKESKQNLPVRVTKVVLGTEASYKGLLVGDRITSTKPQGEYTQFTFERAGKVYALTLKRLRGPVISDEEVAQSTSKKATSSSPLLKSQTTRLPADNAATISSLEPAQAKPAADTDPNTPSNAENTPSFTGKALTNAQQKILADHEIVVIIDRSGSMNTVDCPGEISRWQWCRNQTVDLAKQAQSYLQSNLTIDVFSTYFKVYEQADWKTISDIFQKMSPEGSTNTGLALWDRLSAYLNERTKNPKTTKPLLVAVITDGEPTDGRTTQEAIVSATRLIKDPNLISITFLQVGNGADGNALLEELAHDLPEQGARYEIVDHKTFDQLLTLGLPQALIAAVENPNRVQQSINGLAAWQTTSYFEKMHTSLEKKLRRYYERNPL